MPFDETTSKPFKNVSIQLILNEDDQKDQSIKQEDWQTPLSSPNDIKGGELPNSTFVEGKVLSESPYGKSTNVAPSAGPGSGTVGSLGTTSSNHVGMGAPAGGSEYYQQNVSYNIRVPYYPIQSTPDYTDNRRGRRFRRRYNQIVRKYMCSFPGCTKSYGSLNHLNTHIVSKKHGQRKSKADFQSHEDQAPHNLHANAGGWAYGNPPPPHTGHQHGPALHPSGPAYLHLPHQIPQDPRLQPQQPHVPHSAPIAAPQSYYLQQSVWMPNYPPQFHQHSHPPPPPSSIQPQNPMPQLHPPPPIIQQQQQHPQHQIPQPLPSQHITSVQQTNYSHPQLNQQLQPLHPLQQPHQLQLQPSSHLQPSSLHRQGPNFQEESVFSSSSSEESEKSPSMKAE